MLTASSPEGVGVYKDSSDMPKKQNYTPSSPEEPRNLYVPSSTNLRARQILPIQPLLEPFLRIFGSLFKKLKVTVKMFIFKLSKETSQVKSRHT